MHTGWRHEYIVTRAIREQVLKPSDGSPCQYSREALALPAVKAALYGLSVERVQSLSLDRCVREAEQQRERE